MSPALLALAVVLAVALGAALAYAVRIDDRLDRELRRLGRHTCSTTCTACSTTRRAENGDEPMNTHTRTRSRRGRTLAREDRRTALRLLLARADRGALTREDAAHLRTLAEAEIAECDTFRRSAGGQQSAALRLHRRIDAAEQAMREIEVERDEYAAEAEALRAAAGKGEQ
ncbi:hypothetical protein AAGT00_16485 [Streptomyces cavourensis]